MLTPPDGRPDGSKLGYLDQPSYERFDPALYALLKQVKKAPDARRLTLIEESEIIPSAIYVNAHVPDNLAERQLWFVGALAALKGADLVFFDPDNGLEVASKRKGQINSSKYLYCDEVEVTYGAGHSILIYQHFPREERGAFIIRIARILTDAVPNADVWVFRTAHVAFFLLAHPNHTRELNAAAQTLAQTNHHQFLTAECLKVVAQ